jgi:hypothetical protein
VDLVIVPSVHAGACHGKPFRMRPYEESPVQDVGRGRHDRVLPLRLPEASVEQEEVNVRPINDVELDSSKYNRYIIV